MKVPFIPCFPAAVLVKGLPDCFHPWRWLGSRSLQKCAAAIFPQFSGPPGWLSLDVGEGEECTRVHGQSGLCLASPLPQATEQCVL